MGSLIIISGPVGAGKSAIAREIVASASGACAYIEGDTYWSFIQRPLKSNDPLQNFKMVMRAMIASARHFERDDYEVIVDFSIPPWYVDAVRRLFSDKPFHYVVIRPSEAVCAARAAARADGTIADYGPYSELYAVFDGGGRFTIADDVSSAADLAARIRADLSKGVFLIV